jgi:ankyrin repeat protein
MREHLQRLIVAATAALALAAGACADPPLPNAMAKTSTIFFPSGLQQQLELAVRADDPGAIDRLLASGAGVDARGRHGVTPLMVAVDAQSPRAVATLLRAGADPNLIAADGAGPVHLAVESRGTPTTGRPILEMILRSGGDPDTRRPDGDPILVRFAVDHDLDGLRWLRSRGADLDIRGRSGRPVISDIAYGQDWDSVWTLIELGARYDYEDTPYPLSRALDSPYASSPDASLYPSKLKVWQLLKDHGLTKRPFRTLGP